MMIWRVAGLAVGWAVALLWATRGGAWLRGMSRLSDLRRETPGTARGSLSVIVPARNEGQSVGAGLRSLLASKGVELEVIAVDDRSTDETGLVMDALEREPREGGVRYVVEHVQELAPGWLGKPQCDGAWSSACYRGMAPVYGWRCGLRRGDAGACAGLARA